MIKSFILSVIGTVFMGTVCEMIIPEGNLKKYFRLAMGFVMMSVLISPVKNLSELPEFEFSFTDTMTEEELRAESDAFILKLHEENIKTRIKELCGDKTEVFVEVFSDGRVKSVKLAGSSITDGIIESIKKETGCENVIFVSGEEDET